MSLYRFKSRETGDVLMLQPLGQRILEILGKDPEQPGIILPTEMAAAVQALKDAATEEEADRQRQTEEARANGELPPQFDLPLKVRIPPFVEMLHRCQQADVEVVWGV